MRAWVLFALALAGFAAGCSKPAESSSDEFGRLSREGKKQYEAGAPARAVTVLEQAAALQPTNRDAHLNLANAHLANNQPEEALKHAEQALALDDTSASAHYLMGSAYLRLGQGEKAVQSLQQAKDFDPTVNPVSFQLGRAYQLLNNVESAAAQFEEVVLYEPDHPAAHYLLSQVYRRLGQEEAASTALAEHQRVAAAQPGPVTDLARFERCRYTRIVVPFELRQPAQPGVPVQFADATDAVLGNRAYRGPVAILDVNQDGFPELVLREDGTGLRLLTNAAGALAPGNGPIAGTEPFDRVLVGDMNNDLVEDVLLLSSQGARLLKFDTNGLAADLTRFSKLEGITATNGVLMDVDYSGTLDLLLTGPDGFKCLRNVARTPGNPYFLDYTTNFVGAAGWASVQTVAVEDWDRDELLDVIIGRAGESPLLVARQREGSFASTNAFAGLPEGGLLAVGDLNNDALPDLVLLAGREVICLVSGANRRERLGLPWAGARVLELVDYDNDGWLDIVVGGVGVAVWRNLGAAGFADATQALRLSGIGAVHSLVAADLDGDCDPDLAVTLSDGSVRVLRNEGGNANHALKLRLIGTKSNASGLGIRVEVTAEGLHLSRRVRQVPVEIGVGSNVDVESLAVHWFDFTLATVDLKSVPCQLFSMQELGKQEGSCPYLYAWDGQGHRFVTDLLGAAPLGLPISESRLIDADPHEYVWIGSEERFPPKDGEYVLQVTEELREVLYLDEAKLVVVDHPAGTEVHTTGKLLPRKPFPHAEIIALGNERPLVRAVDDSGRDITAALRDADQQFTSPTQLRSSQLRGLAEPFAVTLDFGQLDATRPLVLAITAWLRFGGGTVNVAASLDPDLPFPFPTLEVERADGLWHPVDVVVGAPAGRTKNMVVDLAGRLPSDSRRLRLRTAFEIHWDRIALLERLGPDGPRVHRLSPTRTDLHWRGFSADLDLPWYFPTTPDYDVVHQRPVWRWTPSGWCTRYGPVDDLLEAKDNALVLMNGGDELTLGFAAAAVPEKPQGWARTFFFYGVGWDKDANVHVVRGREVEPLPWHGMDDQRYGEERRPEFSNDAWIERYNTRWVGPRTLARRP